MATGQGGAAGIVRSDADSTRSCGGAVFPIPASPRKTNDRASARRTARDPGTPSAPNPTGMAPMVILMKIHIASDLVGDTGIEPVTSSV
jgi:hypothetical protein